jgi:dipeptidyl aminopeptidase/acylaminoacyl peptidase
VLVTDPQGLSLSVLDADKSTELRPLAVGLPFYLAWRDDGKALVTHVGGAREEDHGAEVSLIDIGKAGKDPKSATQRVTDQPAAFRAPGWSPDGSQFAYAAWRGEKRSASLFLKPRSGAEGRELARVSGRLVFSWAPDGEALAVAEAGSPEAPFFAGINLVAVTDGHRDPVFAGPLGAFFWAPDGRRLMIAAPEFDSGEWAWIVVERNTRQAREVMRFLPSPDFQMLILHFDQYALSHRLWAPDSRHFVFAAYRANRTAEAGPVPPAVWMIDTTTAKVHQLAEGRSAFWSPR